MSLESTHGPEQPPGTISEYLEAGRRRLDLKLTEAEQLVAAAALDDASDRFSEFAGGLNRHIEAGGGIQFRAVEALTGQFGPTTVMRAEHVELRGRVNTAAEALSADDAAVFKASADALAVVPAIHSMKEEYLIYPVADAAVSSHTRDDMVRRMLAR